MALAHARAMIAAGADLIDVGGSPRGPTRASPRGELERIGAVVSALAGDGIIVSMDTLRTPPTAPRGRGGRRAAIINDVSGGRWDPDMNAARSSVGLRLRGATLSCAAGHAGERLFRLRRGRVGLSH